VRRVGHEKIQNFFVQREVISVASLSSRTLRGNIGYLRIKQFQRGTHGELLEAIAGLREQSLLSGVILDLRNNPGGLVREAVASVDEFLDRGGIYSTRRRGETVDKIDATTGGALLTQPLVVLVNEYSASAAELVAGALQDNDRATVVGAPTFGKGSVQSIIELPDNAALRLTTQRYYTPDGSAIQARGIRPDVLVEAAYVEDDSFGVVRESDLENHLAPEAGSKPTTAAPRDVTRPAPESSDISPTHLGVAREVPEDPTGGPDFALSIGYQILRAVLTKSN
jgi:carboxyl-terminal processing protease